jgi:AcrR family transcriptional regulator
LAKVSDAHLEARRRSILDAATRVFSQKGVELATMAEVAAEAGISPGAIYRYFENKEELAHGCMNAKAEAIDGQWEHVDETTPDPLGAFHELARATLSILNEPEARVDTQLAIEQFLVVARSSEGTGMDHDSSKKVVDGIALRLKHAKERGQLPADVEPYDLAAALMSFYWGARLLRMADPGMNTDAQLEALRVVMAASGK